MLLDRLCQRDADISGKQSSEPSSDSSGKVSYLCDCLPESRASTPLRDITETQVIHICMLSTWMCVSNMYVSVFKFRCCL